MILSLLLSANLWQLKPEGHLKLKATSSLEHLVVTIWEPASRVRAMTE